MAVRQLSELTWEDARDFAARSAIAILPVGAIEAHGPHLPLGTDLIIAEAMARAGAARLVDAGHDIVVLPTLSYTPAPFAAAFPGTLSLSDAAARAVLNDLVEQLERHAFRTLAIANAHLDPANVAALTSTVETARRRGGVRIIFPDVTRRPWASRLSEEFRSGACHAGRYESSIVLAERPELVRDPIRRALPANPASLSKAIRAGRQTFEEAGGPSAYFGYPADATADEGAATVDVLGAILAEAVLAEVTDVG